jgi:hypothetical protein
MRVEVALLLLCTALPFLLADHVNATNITFVEEIALSVQPVDVVNLDHPQSLFAILDPLMRLFDSFFFPKPTAPSPA